MPNADDIFRECELMRTERNRQSPRQQFEAYCRDVLNSVEALHFDYKEKRDTRGFSLDESDKRNLAKAVSGFANSGGGVLLWGVTDSFPSDFKPITEAEKFLRNLLHLAPQATDPTVPGLDGCWVPSAADAIAGFVALLIPESQLPPHQVVLKLPEVQFHYYIRSGSSFVDASHTQLEDMFGRRPRAKLAIEPIAGDFPYRQEHGNWQVHFTLKNVGRATAKNVCVAFRSRLGMDVAQTEDWKPLSGTADTLVLALAGGQVLHPGMEVRFIGVYLAPRGFASGAHESFDVTLYCDGCRPIKRQISGSLSLLPRNR